MAVLSAADIAIVSARFQQAISRSGENVPNCLKADISAAATAADGWANTNAAGYNTALPTPFRTNATAPEKARLLQEVVKRRFEVGA